ncbi:MAG: hypothetical protein WCY75_01965 [Sulfurimonadaceae bacterium]
MKHDELAREVENQAIYLARQIIVIDLNFFNGSKIIYQKYDFFEKFKDYALSGKSLNYTALREYPADKLFQLLKVINSVNSFIRVNLVSYFSIEALNTLNNDLKNIIKLFNEDNTINKNKSNKTDTKTLDIIDIEVHKSRLKTLNSNILKLKEEIADLDEIKDKILIEAKEEVLNSELKNKEETEKDLEYAKQYSKNEQKINNAIYQLNAKSDELTISKKYYEEQRDFFNKYAERAFNIAGVMFGLYVVFCYVAYLFEPSNLNIKDANIIFYLLLIFPIVFPTVMGFLFIRQSNVKSSELNKLNDKYILIHDINQSLSALLIMNKGTNISEKTEKVIYKLIDYILNNNIQKINKENIADSLETINGNLDKTIDTIDKKKSIINWF